MKQIAWMAVACWMGFIFLLSHQPAHVSNELSQGIAKSIAENVDLATNEDFDLGNFNHMIRKNAHFFLYFILGNIVVFTLQKVGVRGMKGILLAIVICVCFAITDEWHQLFVPGRGAQISDVVIDSCGAIVGIMGFVGVGWFVRRARVDTVRVEQQGAE